MDSRFTKQLLYGAGYLILLSLIIAGVYFIWLKPAPTCFDQKQNQNETGIDCGGPCASCEIKTLSPLRVSWIKYFSTGLQNSTELKNIENQTIVVAEIQNPNSNYGARGFTYSLNIYGRDGGLIKDFQNQSLIYAAEIKYLIEPIDINYQNIGDIKIDFSGIAWAPKEEFPLPAIQIRGIETRESDIQGAGVEVTGIVLNNNPYTLSKTRIVGFLFNKDGQELSASKTELQNLAAFAETNFVINFPSNTSLIKSETPTPQTFIFTRDLTIGSRGRDVLELQRFLKNQGFLTAEPTGYFGPATQSALIKYQKKVGISPAAGYFGGKTRADINAQLPKAPTLPSPAVNEADPLKTKVYVEAVR